LDSDLWKFSLSSIDVVGGGGGEGGGRNKTFTSPLRSLVRSMPSEAAHVLDKCVTFVGMPDQEDFQIGLCYEYLEDSYVVKEEEEEKSKKEADEKETFISG
jgi:hypothetical protein